MDTSDAASRTEPADRRRAAADSRQRGVADLLLALVVAILVCWIADSLGSADWSQFFRWTTFAYLLSRGIAKASRVLEQ